MRVIAAFVFFVVFSLPVSAQTWRKLPDPIDRFAAQFLNEVQKQSIAEGVEYCGYIGYNSDDELTATKPKKGKRNGCLPPFFTPWGLDIIATYHTHGSFHPRADSEIPSVRDLESDFDDDLDGYVATPGGRLWVNIRKERATLLLCGRNCLFSDPKFVDCAPFGAQGRYSLRDLIIREETTQGGC